jgi:cardiolipin synthase A/B
MTQPDIAFPIGIETHVPPAVAGSYPLRSGNLVRPLIDGVPTFRRIAEAIEAARHSVWLTVAFFAPDFAFPDGAGSLLDVLDRAVARGLDVRILFWRPNPESSGFGHTFPGSPANRNMLYERGSTFLARWDRAHAAYCQHQKSWLIDAGQPTETAFVGGINLTAQALGSPGHRERIGRHDLYVEVTGPSATDVHHNFVQRWNEASEREQADGVWGHDGPASLPFPSRASEPKGTSVVQIQRMVHPGRYTDSHDTPDGPFHDISMGERSILEQYERAIEAATSTIYIENQALPISRIALRLEDALKRGVDVILLVPANPEDHVRAARLDPARTAVFDRVEALGRYENFTLAGLAVPGRSGVRNPIYVHAKIMLVDDVWATIGSCNLHANSLSGHSEMNAAIWDPGVVRGLRCQLLAEHLDRDTTSLDDRAAFRLYRQVADRNRRGADSWQGLACALTPSGYAR